MGCLSFKVWNYAREDVQGSSESFVGEFPVQIVDALISNEGMDTFIKVAERC